MESGITKINGQRQMDSPRPACGDASELGRWISYLKACRTAEFLFDRPREGVLPQYADAFDFTIENQDLKEFNGFCQYHGLSELVVLLAAFRVAHYRLSGADDALFAIATGSGAVQGQQGGIWSTDTLQTVRITLDDESFEDVIFRVEKTLSNAKNSSKIPFWQIISAMGKDEESSGRPLIPVIFRLHLEPDSCLSFSGHSLKEVTSSIRSMFDIEFHLLQQPGNLRGKILFCPQMYERATIGSIASVFQAVLKTGIAQPKTSIQKLPLLSDFDDSVLNTMGLAQSDQTDYPRDASVIDIFRTQVVTYSWKIAIKDSATQLTYSQLDALSDSVASWLQKQVFPAETIIGVLGDRTCETVAVFLGILKSNLAYLPFDIRSPTSRMEMILSSIPGPKIVLTGQGIEPVSQLQDVEFISFKKAFSSASEKAFCNGAATANSPSATSLAYVMFTSGSTGTPKGVMIEHRGIVRLVKESNMARQLPSPLIMAHLSNIAFDAATWEIYGALLNGGTLVCIDTMTVLDYNALADKFAHESIQTAFFTTALFRQYARDCPSVISQLKMICAGGERLDPRDLAAALKIMRGRFVHVYGPTENTAFSTMYPVLEQSSCLTGVPIGHPISNSGAFVTDSKQRLVPLGVLGELVVTGDGLARGYTDPMLDLDRFISLNIGGKKVRGYRTGDLVRQRSSDGQLDFIGRLDGQVKIRGNRVELGEIEHMLRGNSSVRDAAAVVQKDDRDELQIACFVTIQSDAEPEEEMSQNGDASKRVQAWSHLYDETIYSSITDLPLKKIGRDFTGWTSMYDGQPIARGEMDEWLDDTIDIILNGGQPGHVLEIGTGSGMILFNLGDGLQSYVGLDPSAVAFNFVAHTAKANPTLADKVQIYKATALDISCLKAVLAPTLVIVNSVVQYFPSQNYLLKVFQDILQLTSVKSIVFGDIRSQPLYQQFKVTKAMKMFGSHLQKEDMLSQLREDEGELLLDPGFFTSLTDRFPDVEHVEILPKKMEATNELSCYRYTAVVHIKNCGLQQRDVHCIDKNEWIDFQERGLNRESLLQLLQHHSGSSTVPVCNIPYRKTIFERSAVYCLLEKHELVEETDWLSAAGQEAEHYASLSPTDLVKLAKECGYQVEISWARQYSLKGGFDVVFHQFEPADEGGRVMFRFPTDHHGRELDSLSNHPLRLQTKQAVHRALQEALKANLPSYMIPKQIKVLDKMPVNPNGKIDRRVLAQMIQHQAAPKGLLRPPTTESERQMQMIWAEVFNVNVNTFGLDHSFFDLGGTSIDAMRIVGLARKAGFDLTVQEIFRHKKLGHLVPEQLHDLGKVTQAFQSVEMIDSVTKRNVLAHIDGLNIAINSQAIADVLPITSIQHEFLYCPTAWRQYIDYFYMDLSNDVIDLATFKKSCARTLERYPILRTCFLRAMDKYWQVVLRQLHSPLHIQDVDGDLDHFFQTFILNDLQKLSEYEPPLLIILFSHPVHGIRLVVRMQHAQNDALSIPIIFKSLLEGHEGIPSSPDAPMYSQFMSYVYQKRSNAITYWKDLLRGASITQIKPKLRPAIRVAEPKPLAVHAGIDLPAFHDKSFMISTIVNAAWAVLLSQLTGEDDVAYWQFIAGRNSAIHGVEDIVGPCLSAAPTRVIFSSLETPLQLLQFVQDQLMATGEADSLSNDIVKECTNWPTGVMDSVIQHQSFGETPSLYCFGAERQIRFFENPYLLEPYPWISSFTNGSRLNISLFATTGIVTIEKANHILKDMCTIVQLLMTDFDRPLPEWLQNIQSIV